MRKGHALRRSPCGPCVNFLRKSDERAEVRRSIHASIKLEATFLFIAVHCCSLLFIVVHGCHCCGDERGEALHAR